MNPKDVPVLGAAIRFAAPWAVAVQSAGARSMSGANFPGSNSVSGSRKISGGVIALGCRVCLAATGLRRDARAGGTNISAVISENCFTGDWRLLDATTSDTRKTR